MITLLQLNKAINDTITAALNGTDFSEVPLIAYDTKEGIKRPCIKVEMQNCKNGKFNINSREKTLTVRVYFFASDRYQYKIENVKMQDILENAFLEGLQTQDYFISIDEVQAETIDTVLELSFDLHIIDLLPEPTTDSQGETIETMNDLEINNL